MTLPRPGRSASVALAVTLACGLTPAAQAGDWFFNKCHRGCADNTVTLPAQRVVVETTAPRVAIEETVRPSRGVIAPFAGNFFVPMAFPVQTFGVVAAGQSDGDTTQQDHMLKGIHAAEVAGSRHAKALAAARSDVEYAKRVLDRSVTPSDVNRSTTTTRDAASDQLDQSIKALNDKVDKLADRVNAVEKLILIHDNYLRDKIANPPKP
jgi:hypothetical protein